MDRSFEAPDKIIELRSASWSYDGKTAVLDNISCAISRGSFTTILGPNGSGKTTFLKTVLRMLPPQENTIYLEKRDILKWTQKGIAREIGMVPQNTYSQYTFTVEEIITMGRYPHLDRFSPLGSHDKKQIRAAMEKTETFGLRSHTIHEISGGELQRVIIARALAQEPNILALDEPTSHLDPKHRLSILKLLKQLSREEHITVICIMHDLNSAMQYSDHILLLNAGTVYTSGRPEDVLTPEIIRNVYGIETQLISSGTARPYIVEQNNETT